MLRRYSQVLAFFFFLFDMLMTLVALTGAFVVRFHAGVIPLHPAGIPDAEGYIEAIPFALLIAGVIYWTSKLYVPRRVNRIRVELLTIIKVSLLTAGGYAAAGFFYREFFFSRAVLVMFTVANVLLLGASRIVLRSLLRWIRARGRNLRHAVIIGSGRLGQRVADAIEKNPWTGIQVAGFLDDDPDRLGKVVRNIPVLGKVEDASVIVRDRGIQMVFVALPFQLYNSVEDLVKSLSREVADVKIIPDVSHICRLEIPVTDFDGLAMLSAQANPLMGWNCVLKRITDVSVAILLLILSCPIWLLIALLVKLTSKGPIFYKQTRMGFDGETFSIYKFRTMKVDAEGEQHKVGWTSHDDPRRTRLGIFLRRTSLDEVPQFFNVLRGDMSIVGPRPERPALISEFREDIPLYMLRHKIKAGITGWAQVNGWRGDTSLRKRLQYDLYYLRHWSIWFDIWIMLLTPIRGFIHKNAY